MKAIRVAIVGIVVLGSCAVLWLGRQPGGFQRPGMEHNCEVSPEASAGLEDSKRTEVSRHASVDPGDERTPVAWGSVELALDGLRVADAYTGEAVEGWRAGVLTAAGVVFSDSVISEAREVLRAPILGYVLLQGRYGPLLVSPSAMRRLLTECGEVELAPLGEVAFELADSERFAGASFAVQVELPASARTWDGAIDPQSDLAAALLSLREVRSGAVLPSISELLVQDAPGGEFGVLGCVGAYKARVVLGIRDPYATIGEVALGASLGVTSEDIPAADKLAGFFVAPFGSAVLAESYRGQTAQSFALGLSALREGELRASIMPLPSCRLRGRFAGWDGGEATLYMDSEWDSRRRWDLTVGSDGRFEVGPLMPGRYRVRGAYFSVERAELDVRDTGWFRCAVEDVELGEIRGSLSQDGILNVQIHASDGTREQFVTSADLDVLEWRAVLALTTVDDCEHFIRLSGRGPCVLRLRGVGTYEQLSVVEVAGGQAGGLSTSERAVIASGEVRYDAFNVRGGEWTLALDYGVEFCVRLEFGTSGLSQCRGGELQILLSRDSAYGDQRVAWSGVAAAEDATAVAVWLPEGRWQVLARQELGLDAGLMSQEARRAAWAATCVGFAVIGIEARGVRRFDVPLVNSAVTFCRIREDLLGRIVEDDAVRVVGEEGLLPPERQFLSRDQGGLWLLGVLPESVYTVVDLGVSVQSGAAGEVGYSD